MLSAIIGVFWIMLGIFWLIKPQSLKNRLQKKMARRLKWIIAGFILVLGFSIIGSVLKAHGIWFKIAGLAALIMMVRIFVFINRKTSEKLFSWWQGRPLIFFRIWGVAIFALGLMLVL